MNDIDLEAVKQVQQVIWSQGDFSKIGELAMIVGEELCEAVDVFPGERVLDVACGQGNASVAAARRTWSQVTGLDYVPELIERAKERAAAEHLDIDYVVGDAENLPFDDASFDAVLSTFGAMFAPDQVRTAEELLRVTKPSGRIGMANWTPEGFVGQMFMTVAKHAPPPPGVAPPIRWGTEEGLREFLGDGIAELRLEKAVLVMRYQSAEAFLEFFRSWFGPMKMAYERVGEEGEEALTTDMLELIGRFNRSGGEPMVVDSEYLRVVAVRA